MEPQETIAAHPAPVSYQTELAECVAACLACAQACTSCADACLAEEEVAQLRRCIRTDLDCADICALTGRILSRQTELDLSLLAAQVKVCREACDICARECEQHRDHHAHCAHCADACRACDTCCRELLKLM